MKRSSLLLFLIAWPLISIHAADPSAFSTTWITPKPEVLTYKSASPQGDGLYQISLLREGTGIGAYLNIITPGFTKTITAHWGGDMRPHRSSARIIVNGQVDMRTECSYDADSLHISTAMRPYGTVMGTAIALKDPVVDFSQVPVIVRTLALRSGASFSFRSLNPQNNSIVPLILKVTGEESQLGVNCFRVEVEDFEGKAIYWVEKEGQRKVMRIEQPAMHRVTELLP